MINCGTGDNTIIDKYGTTWHSVVFFEGDKGTGERRAVLLPDGTIKEIE